jgi:nucleotide-binding universal stress UspA family protein
MTPSNVRPVSETRRVLLASEGRAYDTNVIDRVATLVDRGDSAEVMSIARIFGSALGFPNPWLLPSRTEWAKQREQVAEAVAALAVHGITATGQVLGSRDAARAIVRHAARQRITTIVMGADSPPPGFFRQLLWSQEPYRVARRGKLLEVILVTPTTP